MKNMVKKIFNLVGLDIVRRKTIGKTKHVDQLQKYSTQTGTYYLPTGAKGDIVVSSIIEGKIYDEDVVNLALKYIEKETTVLDIGANFGQMSLLFSNKVGENGYVYSFEANDFIYQALCHTIEANGRNNIRPIFGAVHDKAGETLIFPEPDFKTFQSYGSYGIDYNNPSFGKEIQSISIDSFHFELPVSLIKIDIQGGDLHAMQGAINTIQRFRMPIIFEYEYQFEEKYNYSFQEYVDFVTSIDYKFARVINGCNFLILPNEKNH
jgi:FkbM family methyltransferase